MRLVNALRKGFVKSPEERLSLTVTGRLEKRGGACLGESGEPLSPRGEGQAPPRLFWLPCSAEMKRSARINIALLAFLGRGSLAMVNPSLCRYCSSAGSLGTVSQLRTAFLARVTVLLLCPHGCFDGNPSICSSAMVRKVRASCNASILGT
jgi:hypothetical protein